MSLSLRASKKIIKSLQVKQTTKIIRKNSQWPDLLESLRLLFPSSSNIKLGISKLPSIRVKSESEACSSPEFFGVFSDWGEAVWDFPWPAWSSLLVGVTFFKESRICSYWDRCRDNLTGLRTLDLKWMLVSGLKESSWSKSGFVTHSILFCWLFTTKDP